LIRPDFVIPLLLPVLFLLLPVVFLRSLIGLPVLSLSVVAFLLLLLLSVVGVRAVVVIVEPSQGRARQRTEQSQRKNYGGEELPHDKTPFVR
jgi:hypothetical protein